MIIPLDKLQVYSENKYIFTRAAMSAVDKVANLEDYPESNHSWKIVPNILKLTLEEQVKIYAGRAGEE